MGGWLGDTNPSFALEIDNPDKAIDIAKTLGYALSQQGMMVTSDVSVEGTKPCQGINVELPKAWSEKEISGFYKRLWDIPRPDGVKQTDETNGIILGHSTVGGKMLILNTVNAPEDVIRDMIEYVAEEIGISAKMKTDVYHTAYVDQSEYERDDDEYSNSLRRQVSEELERKLAKTAG